MRNDEIGLGKLKLALAVLCAACIGYQGLNKELKALLPPWLEAVSIIALATAYTVEKYLQKSVGTQEEKPKTARRKPVGKEQK